MPSPTSANSLSKKKLLVTYLERLGEQKTQKLIESARNCYELDRCLAGCSDTKCEFHDFLLLIRNPSGELLPQAKAWVDQITEARFKDILAAPLVCSTQAFCIQYCAASCAFSDLFSALGQSGHLALQERLQLVE